jgi:hypothetical protein
MFVQHGAQVNQCSRSFDETEHTPECPGKCERLTLSDLEVDLHNEVEHWKQAGMALQGVPQMHPPLPMPGLGIDLLHNEVKLNAMISLVMEALGISQEEIDNKIRQHMLDKLKTIRTKVEGDQLLEGLLVPEKQIFIPTLHPKPDDEIKH